MKSLEYELALPLQLEQEIATKKLALTSIYQQEKKIKKEFKVSDEPCFVLHSYPYKETSLIVDVFSQCYGRVSLVAKGAKRPHSQFRHTLQTFQPLMLSWSGKNELPVLTKAEWVGGMLPLEKSALLCGFYINELLTKFLLRKEVHTDLFNNYVATLNELAHLSNASIVLRKFELNLLKESGLVGDLSHCDMSGSTILSNQFYVIDPQIGIRLTTKYDTIPSVIGKTLLDMQTEDYSDPVTQSQSKILMRFLLSNQLNGAVLKTRQILLDLQNL